MYTIYYIISNYLVCSVVLRSVLWDIQTCNAHYLVSHDYIVELAFLVYNINGSCLL